MAGELQDALRTFALQKLKELQTSTNEEGRSDEQPKSHRIKINRQLSKRLAQDEERIEASKPGQPSLPSTNEKAGHRAPVVVADEAVSVSDAKEGQVTEAEQIGEANCASFSQSKMLQANRLHVSKEHCAKESNQKVGSGDAIATKTSKDSPATTSARDTAKKETVLPLQGSLLFEKASEKLSTTAEKKTIQIKIPTKLFQSASKSPNTAVKGNGGDTKSDSGSEDESDGSESDTSAVDGLPWRKILEDGELTPTSDSDGEEAGEGAKEGGKEDAEMLKENESKENLASDKGTEISEKEKKSSSKHKHKSKHKKHSHKKSKRKKKKSKHKSSKSKERDKSEKDAGSHSKSEGLEKPDEKSLKNDKSGCPEDSNVKGTTAKNVARDFNHSKTLSAGERASELGNTGTAEVKKERNSSASERKRDCDKKDSGKDLSSGPSKKSSHDEKYREEIQAEERKTSKSESSSFGKSESSSSGKQVERRRSSSNPRSETRESDDGCHHERRERRKLEKHEKDERSHKEKREKRRSRESRDGDSTRSKTSSTKPSAVVKMQHLEEEFGSVKESRKTLKTHKHKVKKEETQIEGAKASLTISAPTSSETVEPEVVMEEDSTSDEKKYDGKSEPSTAGGQDVKAATSEQAELDQSGRETTEKLGIAVAENDKTPLAGSDTAGKGGTHTGSASSLPKPTPESFHMGNAATHVEGQKVESNITVRREKMPPDSDTELPASDDSAKEVNAGMSVILGNVQDVETKDTSETTGVGKSKTGESCVVGTKNRNEGLDDVEPTVDERTYQPEKTGENIKSLKSQLKDSDGLKKKGDTCGIKQKESDKKGKSDLGQEQLSMTVDDNVQKTVAVKSEKEDNTKSKEKEKEEEKEEGALESDIEEGEISHKHKKSKKKDKKKGSKEREKQSREKEREKDKRASRDRDRDSRPKKRHSESKSSSRSHKKHKRSRSKTPSPGSEDSDISIDKDSMVEKSVFSESKGVWITTMVPREDSREPSSPEDDPRQYRDHDSRRGYRDSRRRDYGSEFRSERRSVFDRLGYGQRDRFDRRSRYDGFRRRRRSYSRSRSRSRSWSPVLEIDKKKLLEIAKANALSKMQTGEIPAHLPVPESIRKAADTMQTNQSIQRFTEQCMAFANTHGESSDESPVNRPVGSSDEEDEEESDVPKPFVRHPFKVKEAVPIVMNIKNAVQIPVASKDKLRVQFPVSSGSQHRKKEEEIAVAVANDPYGQWTTVEQTAPATKPKAKPSTAASATGTTPSTATSTPGTTTANPSEAGSSGAVTTVAAVAGAPTPTAAPNIPGVTNVVPPQQVEDKDKVFEDSPGFAYDISAIVSARLKAARALQSNPNNVEALTVLHHSQRQIQTWAHSSQKPGLFTGSTDATFLNPQQLANPNPKNQAWIKKDMFKTAAPVSTDIGLSLMHKMGWRQGEGLGKNKEGAINPLLLEIKTDRQGLVAEAEKPKKKGDVSKVIRKDLSGKHPVMALNELCSKKHWGKAVFELLREDGPAHKKNFLFKVRVRNEEYIPTITSGNKKDAKAMAATVALQKMGLIPT
ncbi:uncharacterized protein [Diadema setosum]|uniref:uncharacterized protein n=1 Tax=Diadema setosum TaxID=31175 RepID=UPI003B3A278A